MKLHELLCQFHNDNVNANPTKTTAIDFQYQEQHATIHCGLEIFLFFL